MTNSELGRIWDAYVVTAGDAWEDLLYVLEAAKGEDEEAAQ